LKFCAIWSAPSLKYLPGFTPSFWKTLRAKRSVQLPCGEATVLPSNHFTASSPLANSGASLRTRKMLHCCSEVPSAATMRMSATSGFELATIAGMSPM
jgi:hypothetical protein